MLTAADNELLTRTGPGTPMGAYFRRHWLPVALSRELPAPDGPPVRLTVLGEELLAFRDTAGRVGLVQRRCPHRGADLYFGRNEEHGLRCVYHGWKFDVTGRCLEAPNARPDSGYCETVRLAAYPTREFGEMVWAYLGPDAPPDEPPRLEVGLVPGSHRFVTKKLQFCNWAQSVEGALDTAHFSFLHMPAPAVQSNANPDATADERRLRWMRLDPLPRFTIAGHEAGFVAGAARQGEPGELYWRTTQFMLPAHSSAPSTLPGETYYGYTWVPTSDLECWIYTYAWNPERPLGEAERAKIARGHGVIAEVDEAYVPLRNLHNGYLIDRAAQRSQTYTGIRGLAEQDAMIQESQGPIADRTQERLTETDAAVVRFRRLMLAEAKALLAGTAPAAPRRPAAYRTRSGSWTAPAATPFAEVMRQRFGDPVGLIHG